MAVIHWHLQALEWRKRGISRQDTGRLRWQLKTIYCHLHTLITFVPVFVSLTPWLSTLDRRPGKTNKSSISTHLTAATPPSMNLDVAHSNFGVIGGVAACLVTIMTVVIVLILYRHKLTRTQGGSPERSINDGQNIQENHEGHEYEEIQESIQLADQLHYASVSFQSHSATGSTDRAENGSSACDYSTVKLRGAPPPLYSTLETNNEEL